MNKTQALLPVTVSPFTCLCDFFTLNHQRSKLPSWAPHFMCLITSFSLSLPLCLVLPSSLPRFFFFSPFSSQTFLCSFCPPALPLPCYPLSSSMPPLPLLSPVSFSLLPLPSSLPSLFPWPPFSLPPHLSSLHVPVPQPLSLSPCLTPFPFPSPSLSVLVYL